jgi:hypothetical protein
MGLEGDCNLGMVVDVDDYSQPPGGMCSVVVELKVEWVGKQWSAFGEGHHMVVAVPCEELPGMQIVDIVYLEDILALLVELVEVDHDIDVEKAYDVALAGVVAVEVVVEDDKIGLGMVDVGVETVVVLVEEQIEDQIHCST